VDTLEVLEVSGDTPWLVVRVAAGHHLTEDERTQYDAYVGAWKRENDRQRELLGLTDMGLLMSEGVTPPQMLTVDTFVEEVDHAVYGPKEQGKTWLVMGNGFDLVKRGKRVVWVDKEMGPKLMVERLQAFGVTPEQASEFFIYLDHPIMDCSAASCASWEALLKWYRPALVVVDAQTEVLADAGLSENLATDVAKWRSCYFDPCRRIRAATVMIDHVGHEVKGRQRGSGHKGAAAKVELYVEKTKDYGRDHIGRIVVYCNKNTPDAAIPKSKHYRLGGNGAGGFVLEDAMPFFTTDESAALDTILRNVEEYVRKHGSATKTQIQDGVPGTASLIIRARDKLVEDGVFEATPHGSSTLYTYTGDDLNALDPTSGGGGSATPPQPTEGVGATGRTHAEDERTDADDLASDAASDERRLTEDRTHSDGEPRTRTDGERTLTCEECGGAFASSLRGGGATKASYCSSSCRGKAYRRRKKAEAAS